MDMLCAVWSTELKIGSSEAIRIDRWSMAEDQRSAARSGRYGGRDRQRQPAIYQRSAVDIALRLPLAGLARALWGLEEHASTLQSLGGQPRVGEDFCSADPGCQERLPDDRQHDCASASACGGLPKKDDQAVGRSRGGLSTKIHVLCNRLGLPLRLLVTAGQVHDVTQAQTLLAGHQARYVIADRGYTGDAFRQSICAVGAIPVIPPKRNARVAYPFSKRIYRQRNVIERLINKLKHFRRIATRFEKNAINFLAMLHLAASHLWLRLIDDTT